MTYIKCPKCGKEEPAFDYAHVCGPVEVKKPFSKLLRQFEKESKLEIFGLGARREIWEKSLEKYAELIVQECIHALWTEECRTNAMTQAEYERGGNRIHKHFWS